MSNLTPRYHLRLDTRVGALHLDVKFTLTAPWTVLFGPSGSGKSTILRAICGLLPNADISSACAEYGGGGRFVDGNVECIELDGNHYSIPPHLRAIAYAPQQPSLFPHLTVAANILFAQRSSNASALSQENINDAIKLFRLEDLLSRYPRNLSGGERQLVNLARAFAVPAPRLILLDEPFAGIDRPLRDAILPELRSTLRDRGVPVVSVTHDVEEAFRLQAEVVILRDGRIVDQGYVSKVLADERLNIFNALR